MKRIIISVLFLFGLSRLSAQIQYERFKDIDVLHYKFEIHVNDSTDIIEGNAAILVRFLKSEKTVDIDLVSLNGSTGKGMQVENITSKGNSVSFRHDKNDLKLTFENEFQPNDTTSFLVEYSGIPADGLIISKNKFDDRTFFGDNWPDRAHNWIPCIDHPSDKATVDFIVYAPDKYLVVSNGLLEEETNLENGFKLTHWKENVPISTELMVIGIARFAVLNNGKVNGIPVSSWVFPQNRKEGFIDYAVGTQPIEFYSKLIGPFSYEKLAHVQSKTKWGGIENASCIFYAENSVTGKNEDEYLIAHETAHQWFGDAVTEQNWNHIWLSEGFATYLAHVYMRNVNGNEVFRKALESDRKQVILYAKHHFAPIIDTTVTDYNKLLNTNSYQKASWFLHMLNEEIGDSLFFNSLRLYYSTFRDSTALTNDFQKVVEKISDRNLGTFFHEWLYQPGFPQLKINWKQTNAGNFTLKVEQVQNNFLFHFPLEIEFKQENGETVLKTFAIKNRKSEFSFIPEGKVTSVTPDPKTKLLFEEIQ